MPPPTTIERLRSDADITATELRTLRSTLPTLEPNVQTELSAAIDGYLNRRAAYLQAHAETHDALLALQQSVQAPQNAGEEWGRTAGGAIGGTLQDTLERSRTLAYNEWKELTHPGKSTGDKIMRGLGLLAIGYGIYRAAKWATGKKEDSAMGKILKWTGLAAAAGWAVNHFGKKAAAPSPLPSSAPAPAPPPTPTAPPGSPTASPTASPSMLSAFPDTKNLVDQPATTVTVNGTPHAITFSKNAITIDGTDYGIWATQFGISLPVTIENVHCINDTLSITAGAGGQRDTVQADETKLREILATLLGKRPYETKTATGIPIMIDQQ